MAVRVLMVSMSPLEHDERINRAATALRDDGYEVSVLGLGPEPKSVNWIPIIVGSKENKSTTRRGRRWDLLRSLFLVAHRRRRRRWFNRSVKETFSSLGQFDIVHAHDLPALEAILPSLQEENVIFDSHELWSGRKLRGMGSWWEKKLDEASEKKLTANVDVVITVSLAIAQILSKQTNKEIVVIRNTFPLDLNKRPISMSYLAYAGNIAGDRDLVTVFQGAQKVGMEVRFMGKVIAPIPEIENMVVKAGTVSEAGAFVRKGGIAIVSLEGESDNHRFALPNKLFQAISVGVPVVAADLPSIAEVVAKHGIGALYSPGDPDSFARAVERVRADYFGFLNRVQQAGATMSWDLDRKKLLDVYTALSKRQALMPE